MDEDTRHRLLPTSGTLAAATCLLLGCSQVPFSQQDTTPAENETLIGAEFPTRWFPRSVRFSADDTHLLMTLCHFRYSYYCRVARYWIADSRWEIFPAKVGESLAWPDASPDGKHIIYAQAHCSKTYQCFGAEFTLATMNADGTDRRELGPLAVQMPTYSPDGSRIMYWRVQGSSALSSGRSIGYWSLYEYSKGNAFTERQLTDELYWGIYGAPRYLPDGKRLLYTAYRGDGMSEYTFVIRRDEGMRHQGRRDFRGPIPPWNIVRTQFIHAFHPRWGWLVSYKALWFEPDTSQQVKRQLLSSAPYTTSVADVSHDGNWVAALSTVSGTMKDGGRGVANYWAESPSGIEGPPRTPVMTLTHVSDGTVRAITNWPADVEKVMDRAQSRRQSSTN